MRNTCSPRKKSQDSSNYNSLKSLKEIDVFWIYWQKEHTLSIGYGIWLQNKNTWLSRSRRWMSLNFYFHRYLFFIRVGTICRKQRRFCNCVHVLWVGNVLALFRRSCKSKELHASCKGVCCTAPATNNPRPHLRVGFPIFASCWTFRI